MSAGPPHDLPGPAAPKLGPGLRATASAPHLPTSETLSLHHARSRVSISSKSPPPRLPVIGDVALTVTTTPSMPHPHASFTPAGPASPTRSALRDRLSPLLPIHSAKSGGGRASATVRPSTGPYDDPPLAPAMNPPRWHMFDIFPFSLFVSHLTKKGVELKGKRAARVRARLQTRISHNIPLEISFYLVRVKFTQEEGNASNVYHRALTSRRYNSANPLMLLQRVRMGNYFQQLAEHASDLLINSQNMLVDSLTGNLCANFRQRLTYCHRARTHLDHPDSLLLQCSPVVGYDNLHLGTCQW